MGKILTGGVLSSDIKGKIGDVVFTRLNRETIVKKYQPIVTNPQTTAQKIQRKKFANIGKTVSNAYRDGAKKYGVKIAGNNIYSAMARTIFKNKVVLSLGYSQNYYPKTAPKTFDFLAYNTNIKGDALEYLNCYLYQGADSVLFGCGFVAPENICSNLGTSQFSQLVLGSNVAFSDIKVTIVINGTIQKTVQLFSYTTEPKINEHYTGIDDGGAYFAQSEDDINSKFKYIYKLGTGLGFKKNGVYYMSGTEFFEAKPQNFGGSVSDTWDDYLLPCGVLGEPITKKMGVSLFAFTGFKYITSLEQGNTKFEVGGSVLMREMLFSKNVYINEIINLQ